MLLYITDQSHPECFCIIAEWRHTEDSRIVEYRYGGVWLNLHILQFSFVENF